MKPTAPETGFGYIKRTDEEVVLVVNPWCESKQVKPGCFKIDQFKEKPDLKTAQEVLFCVSLDESRFDGRRVEVCRVI